MDLREVRGCVKPSREVGLVSWPPGLWPLASGRVADERPRQLDILQQGGMLKMRVASPPTKPIPAPAAATLHLLCLDLPHTNSYEDGGGWCRLELRHMASGKARCSGAGCRGTLESGVHYCCCL